MDFCNIPNKQTSRLTKTNGVNGFRAIMKNYINFFFTDLRFFYLKYANSLKI